MKPKPKELIQLARNAIETKKVEETKFKDEAGVFVTLSTYPKHELRGCIGFAEAVFPIGEAVQRAAIAAAYSDPRFSPVEKNEFESITVEVSVLSRPKEIKVEKVKKGDGLILEKGHNKGLFLPQVWESLPDKNNFLDNLCMKAGLFQGCWKDKNMRLLQFHVDAFEEEKPNGKVKKVRI